MSPRGFSRAFAVLASLLTAFSFGCRGLPAHAATDALAPRVVLVLVVDQLRRDRLTAKLPGGLGRIVREGRVFENAALAHAYTETCPGHASILSGRHPGPAGITGNSFIEKKTMELVYCVADPSSDSASFGGTGEGRSPRNLRATTLGDWIKLQHPSARVFAVSGKDRSAIMLGGQQPDGVYWLDWRGRGSFTTSRYYAATLPDWVSRWKRDRILKGVPQHWVHESGDPPNGARIDDFPGETRRFSRVSPHPLPPPLPDVAVTTGQDEVPAAPRADAVDTTLTKLYFSPYVDDATLRFAKELVETESIGNDDVPDLLAIGLSGTDLVGHLYGPESQEARDGLLRLDRAVGEFLEFLERRVGKGRLLVGLSSDHGVMPLPEALRADGLETCPVAGGRIPPGPLVSGLQKQMVARFGAFPEPTPGAQRKSTPTANAEAEGWLIREGSRFTVNRPVASERGADPDAIVAAASEFLSAQPGVSRVMTPASFENSSDEMAALYRNSHDPERGGDLVVELAPGCLLIENAVGTTHGSVYDYDRNVPIVLSGPGIEPGVDSAAAATVDIAPTLAELIGVRAPSGLDGHPLPLHER